jgi:hypothetical protein
MFGGTLRLYVGKPPVIELRMRRRELELKCLKTNLASNSQSISKKIIKAKSSILQKLGQLRWNNSLYIVQSVKLFLKNNVYRFSRFPIFIKDRLLSPPPTPPPVA